MDGSSTWTAWSPINISITVCVRVCACISDKNATRVTWRRMRVREWARKKNREGEEREKDRKKQTGRGERAEREEDIRMQTEQAGGAWRQYGRQGDGRGLDLRWSVSKQRETLCVPECVSAETEPPTMAFGWHTPLIRLHCYTGKLLKLWLALCLGTHTCSQNQWIMKECTQADGNKYDQIQNPTYTQEQLLLKEQSGIFSA